MNIRSVGIIGAGTVGQGIVQTAAAHGLDVVYKELNPEAVEHSRRAIEQALDREIERWAITASEKKACLSRIRGTHTYDPITQCDIVIEALQDAWEKKSVVFKDLDLFMPDDRVLVTNTSTLSVSELGRLTKRSDRVIGMHFLSPVPKRPLVEIVRGFNTSDETFGVARDFAEALGKTAITVFEYPGYVTTRLILPLINEAMHVVMEGVSSPEDVDQAMKLGYDFPIGPLEMADRMGLDEVLRWLDHLRQEIHEAKFRPCPLLRRLVHAGHCGVKTGKGIFSYTAEGERIRETGGVKS
ncbi:3-hydroxybutyryl-CoA dehydrogenase [Candidatus Sumerlaeota bacterium]|nr:3-hydroxybutyryl-CoA dehydrogenase [Candidatus Sumerlaeota bacterium]